MNLTQELLSLLQRRSEGVTDEELSTHFGSKYLQLPPVINELTSANRLSLFAPGGVGLPAVYRIIKEETANKLEGLG